MGHADVLLLPVQHWVLFVGFLGAAYGLLAGRVRPAVLLPSLAAVAMLPTLDRLVGSSLADEPLAQLFALAGIAAALWLLEQDWRLAALSGILLVALPMTKNEGLMLGVALVLMLGAATRFKAWRTLVPLIGVTVLAAVPWRVWHAVNDVRDQSDYRFGDVVHFGRLADRIDRLGIALRDLPGYVVDPGRWLLAVPLVLVLAVLLSRRRTGLAAFSAGTVLIAFAGYLAIYWIGLPEIHFYIDTSGERVAAPLALFCAVLFPLLATEALTGEGAPRPGPGGAPGRVRGGRPGALGLDRVVDVVIRGLGRALDAGLLAVGPDLLLGEAVEDLLRLPDVDDADPVVGLRDPVEDRPGRRGVAGCQADELDHLVVLVEGRALEVHLDCDCHALPPCLPWMRLPDLRRWRAGGSLLPLDRRRAASRRGRARRG